MDYIRLEGLRFGSDVGDKRIVTARFTVSAASQMPVDAMLDIEVTFYARDDDPTILHKARLALHQLMHSAAERAAASAGA